MPIECEEAQAAVDEIFDRELNADDAAILVTHLTDCPVCAEYTSHELVMRRKLSQSLSDDADTDALWQRISAAMDAQDLAKAIPERAEGGFPVLPRRTLMRLGLAASVLLVAGVGGLYTATRTGGPDLVAETVSDYLTFRASGQKLHVEHQQPTLVKQWLEARIDFDISVGAVPPSGFQLAGGRLCSFLGRRLAFLHYRSGDRSAALYVMSNAGLVLPNAKKTRIGSREVTATSSRGITNIAWDTGGLIYVLVSDLPESDALNFVSNI